MSYFNLTDKGLVLHCHVQPKASRDAIAGIYNGRLKVQITAPPTDGKANAHLIRFIAKAAKVAKSAIELTSGHSSRQKTLFLAGLQELPRDFPTPQEQMERHPLQ